MAQHNRNAVQFVRTRFGVKLVAPRLEFHLSDGDVNRLNAFMDRKVEASTIALRRRLVNQRGAAIRNATIEVLRAELDRRADEVVETPAPTAADGQAPVE